MWLAVVKAPQGGPIYTHGFTGETVSSVLRDIEDGLDLEQADAVSITIVKEPEND